MSVATVLQNLPPELRPAMAELMDAMEERIHERYGVQREEFQSLRSVVQELAEAQKRTELRVEELAEAQKRTELRVEELAEAQKRTELRVEELAEAQKRTERRVEELAEAQKRTEVRVEELAVAQKELAEAQKRTEQRLDRLEIVVMELAEAQKRTEQALQALIVRMDAMSLRQDKMSVRLDRVWGRQLEQLYRERAYSYFGRVLRKVRVASIQELEAELETHLTADELDDLRLIDVLVQGRVKDHPGQPDVLLAIEVSAVIDAGDVERAQRRSALLRKAGLLALPVVAGEEITEGADAACRSAAVWVVQDGRQYFWEAALDSLAL